MNYEIFSFKLDNMVEVAILKEVGTIYALGSRNGTILTRYTIVRYNKDIITTGYHMSTEEVQEFFDSKEKLQTYFRSNGASTIDALWEAIQASKLESVW